MIKLLLVDFDGVMSCDKFYAGFPSEHKESFDHLLTTLFRTNDSRLLSNWMRGIVDYRSLHRQIASDIKANAKVYDYALLVSVTRMRLNLRMLETVEYLKSTGVRVALFTNNMDVFDEFTVPYFGLKTHFDNVYSSSQHGKLKFEDDSLFRKACEDVSAQPYEVALVDDSASSIDAMRSLGGLPFHYKNYLESHDLFESWITSISGIGARKSDLRPVC